MEYETTLEWDLWFHSINNNKWDKGSYKKIHTIKNLYDYKIITEIFKQNHYQNGMFFIMKSGVFPNWEDPTNRMGGCLSFKITSDRVIDEWNNILLKCIQERIMDRNNDKVTGISISPKKEFNIIKVWFSDDDFDYKEIFIENDNSELNLNNSLYKKHTFN
ncbi:MAG: hypothetical protein CMH79_05875 [Nitrospinae bacterium]|nr:hypothetical protein [Nitrospinota bacterium]|tara:strand:+ start:1804 stop:2286 length:483 start_codon:yes stop_codon:yes gene_type:complete